MTDVFDVVTIGRVGVDLYPEQSGVSLAEVQTFRKSLGGSSVNVAVAAARLGAGRVAAITKVGDDPFGPYVRHAMEGFGVDTRWVGTDPELRTPIVFCEIHPPDFFPLLFYREPKAPDMNISLDELELDAIRAARLFWTTGTGLSDEPSRSAALMHAMVAVGNQDEVAVAVGTRDPWDASAALLDLGVELAIVKRGPEGVLARTRDELIEVEPVRLEGVNGLGAGDAFGGALAHGLLAGDDVELVIRRANAAGALVASRLACADDMPYLPELEETIEGATR